MSRDFILIFSGGMVSLITTLVVLFVMDYFYRREQLKAAKPESVHPVEALMTPATPSVATKPEPLQPPESKAVLVQEETPTSH